MNDPFPQLGSPRRIRESPRRMTRGLRAKRACPRVQYKKKKTHYKNENICPFYRDSWPYLQYVRVQSFYMPLAFAGKVQKNSIKSFYQKLAEASLRSHALPPCPDPFFLYMQVQGSPIKSSKFLNELLQPIMRLKRRVIRQAMDREFCVISEYICMILKSAATNKVYMYF